MNTKQCMKCSEELPINMFEKSINNDKISYRNKCKSCRLKELQIQREKRKQQPKIIIQSKICNNCKYDLDVSLFNKKSLSKDGYDNICRKCYKITRLKERKINRTALEEELYCIKCKTTKSNSEFRTTKRSSTGYYKTCNTCWKPTQWNKQKQMESEKKYRCNNPEKIKLKYKLQSQKPQRIIKSRLQHRIRGALKSNNIKKIYKTVDYLGCDIQYLRKWLEFQFTHKISWNNLNEWHIDHIIPCHLFDLTKEDEQQKCFNWQNLRPCLANENLEKSNKLNELLIENTKNLVSKFFEINPLPTQPGDRVEGAL